MNVKGAYMLAVFATILLVAGCNIFSWSSDEQAAETHLAKGRQLLSEAKYSEAAEEFAAAMEEEPNRSGPRYYHAKAVAHAAGLNVITMGQIITDADFETGEALPFSGMPRDSQDILYSTNVIISDDLRPIFDGVTYGLFEPNDISMDLAIALGIYGTLRFRDTNSDGHIDENDFSLDVTINENGEFSIGNLEDIVTDSLSAEGFNELLADAESVLVDGGSVVAFMLGDTTGFDPEDLGSVLDNIDDLASNYFVNSGADDNDGVGDGDADGFTDEECINGIDDDGDGLIDEDATIDPVQCPGRRAAQVAEEGGNK